MSVRFDRDGMATIPEVAASRVYRFMGSVSQAYEVEISEVLAGPE